MYFDGISMDIQYLKRCSFWRIIRRSLMLFWYFFYVCFHSKFLTYFKKASKYHRTALNYPLKSGFFIVSNIDWNIIEIVMNYIKIVSNLLWIQNLFLFYECDRIASIFRLLIRQSSESSVNQSKILIFKFLNAFLTSEKLKKHKINNFRAHLLH